MSDRDVVNLEARRPAQEVLERQARLIRRMRTLAAEGISRFAQLLGCDGRFVVVMLAGGGAQTMYHGLDQEQAIAVLREAYEGATKIALPPPVGSA